MTKGAKLGKVAPIIRAWRTAIRRVLVLLAGGPQGAGRHDNSAFAVDWRARMLDACPAARDLTLELVAPVRIAKLDAVPLRELARRLGVGNFLELRELTPLVDRVAAILDELAAPQPKGTRQREREDERDKLAHALAMSWSDPDSPSCRPDGFTHMEVARELGVSRQALCGKQRDKVRFRCPSYMAAMRSRKRERPTRGRNT